LRSADAADAVGGETDFDLDAPSVHEQPFQLFDANGECRLGDIHLSRTTQKLPVSTTTRK